METQMQHTHAPWKLEKDDGFYSIIGDRKDKHCGDQIALTPNSHLEDIANAAFIVKAVNSHEALLDYAKAMHAPDISNKHVASICGICRLISQSEDK